MSRTSGQKGSSGMSVSYLLAYVCVAEGCERSSWSLDESMPLSFGGLVSTSNAFSEGVGDVAIVNIKTDAPIVWTVELNDGSPAPMGAGEIPSSVDRF